MKLSLIKTVAGNTEVPLGSEVNVTGVNYAVGKFVSLRFRVTGSNPTTLQAKAWAAGTSEPGVWNVTATDSTPELQVPGSVALKTYLGSGATNAPVTYSFQNFSAQSPNLAPTAAFTITCTFDVCGVDASASFDPDGVVTNYAWDFGDGGTATGVTAGHTWASAGTWPVTLTVTDNGGATSSLTQNAVVAPDPSLSLLAQDTFARTQSNGWGSADLGGAWTINAPGADWSTVPGTGNVVVATVGGSHHASNATVSARDVDLSVDAASDRTPAGGGWGQVAYLTARRSLATSTDYRLRLRFPVGGGVVKLSIVKVVNGPETQIGNEVNATGVTYAPGQFTTMRFRVTGANPTTLQAKAWPAGTAEPAAWALTVTDSQPELQVAGAPGLRTYLGSGTTNTPVTFSFRNYAVRPSNVPPPAALLSYPLTWRQSSRSLR